MIRFRLVDDRVELAADDADAEALRRLVEQFTGILDAHDAPATPDADAGLAAAPSDPALIRLFPDPVPDDPQESAEVRALTEPALIDHKRTNAIRVAETLDAPGALAPRDELAWLQWLTDIRLVLATRLGILVDGDEGASVTERDLAMQWTYHALGSLQADLIDALDGRASARRAAG